MKKIIFGILAISLFLSCGPLEPNPCLMSRDFIKKDLINPEEAVFSSFDCSSETNYDGSYTILRKISTKNSFGVKKSFIYKVRLKYKGGDKLETSNWILMSMRSEEYTE